MFTNIQLLNHFVNIIRKSKISCQSSNKRLIWGHYDIFWGTDRFTGL